MFSISATSDLRLAIPSSAPPMASWSFIRVSGVRRSWLTPASNAVRCAICPLDAVAHHQERGRRLAHLSGAFGLEIEHLLPLAEPVGGLGEPAHRAHLIAQEEDGDGEQHDRGAHHPHDEDVGGGAEHPLCAT